MARIDLAVTLISLGRYPEARSAAGEAIGDLGPGALRDPLAARYLVLARTVQGEAAREAKDAAAAGEAFTAAVDGAKALTDRDPVARRDNQFCLATALIGRGKLYALDPGRRNLAAQDFAEAVTLLAPLEQRFRHVRPYRQGLAVAALNGSERPAATRGTGPGRAGRGGVQEGPRPAGGPAQAPGPPRLPE